MSSPSTIVLITGANSGIGFAATGVLACASQNYHVIMASRNLEKGKAAVAQVQAMDGIQGTVSSVQLDQDNTESVQKAAKAIEEQFGRIDVLINNAGMGSSDPDMAVRMERTFRTNATGPALVSTAFYHLLLKSSRPYSIYVSSGLGSLGRAADPSSTDYDADYFEYRMSKAALQMWAIQEHKLYSKKGVKTFVMCPGFVVSNLRGTSEEARTGGGAAGSPVVSGELMLSIIEGKRDADVGKFVWTGGLYPW